ncbi:MAG: hypothetical protein ACT4QD_00755 [Acidobacteriota bacterium]
MSLRAIARKVEDVRRVLDGIPRTEQRDRYRIVTFRADVTMKCPGSMNGLKALPDVVAMDMCQALADPWPG